MGKVYVFLADGFEEIEAITPIDVLRRANIDVVTVSISDSEYVTAAHDIIVKADTKINAVNIDDASMLLLPGGMPGAKHLNESDAVKNLLKIAQERNLYIAAICAAPLVLGGIGLLNGKNATCYPGYENELTGANVTAKPVEVADNIITAKGVGAAMNFALQLVTLLKGEALAKELAQKMVVE